MDVDEENSNNFNEFEQNSEPENTNPVFGLDLRDPKNQHYNINHEIRVDIVKLGQYKEKDLKYLISIVDKTERIF